LFYNFSNALNYFSSNLQCSWTQSIHRLWCKMSKNMWKS
jgi:hypothetical protein